jgi:hypothetical protein
MLKAKNGVPGYAPGILAAATNGRNTRERAMSLPVEGVGAWRANVERANPIRAADPMGSGAALSPWQALMATAALDQARVPARAIGSAAGGVAPEWRARVEPGPAFPAPPPVIDDPERIETASRGTTPPAPAAARPPGLFQDGDFSFADLIDVINPLQHIPIVSTLYRELTGDRIGHGARLAGGLLFMGPIGGLTALANVVLLEASGKDAGEHALALFKDDPARAPALAANADSKPEAGANEKALAEILPPGAIPISGGSVEFTEAALRPAALAPTPAPSVAAVDDLPPPPPRSGPVAGPGWKGFYSPPENSDQAAVVPGEPAPARPDRGALVDARGDSPARPDRGALVDARGDSPARPDRGALVDARGDSPARPAPRPLGRARRQAHAGRARGHHGRARPGHAVAARVHRRRGRLVLGRDARRARQIRGRAPPARAASPGSGAPGRRERRQLAQGAPPWTSW